MGARIGACPIPSIVDSTKPDATPAPEPWKSEAAGAVVEGRERHLDVSPFLGVLYIPLDRRCVVCFTPYMEFTTQTEATMSVTWIPRKYGSPLGYVTAAGHEILARDIRRDDVAAMFPDATVRVDRYGMSRPNAEGKTLADILGEEA